MDLELLQRLTEAHGVPGQEDSIRTIVREALGDLCEYETDTMGNLHCVKRCGVDGAKKVMIAAHMDEIGFVVKHIDDKGFLRLQPLGGWDPRQMFSQRVLVHARNGALSGVLMYQTKPKHLLSESEMNKGPEIDLFFVDLGMADGDVRERVRVGDMVTMDRTFQRMGGLLTCKAMDDRVGVFVMIEAVRKARDLQVDVHAIATVQEEIGLRGAQASGWAIQPDVAIALDITLANDIPGSPEQDYVTRLGDGAAIKILDSSLICHPKLVDHFRRLAETRAIPHQMEVLPRGGTDAGAIQRLHGGIPSFTLSIPTRYVHTVNETVAARDVEACIDLLAAYLEDAHHGDYRFI
jgi:tetrahedral aminopeptidase